MTIKRLIKIPCIILLFSIDRLLNLFRRKDNFKSLFSVERILVINFCRIGDIVCTTPLLKNLRETFTNAQIDIAVTERTNTLLQNNPNINHVYCFRNIFRFISTLYKLKTNNYELIILPVWMLKQSVLALLLNPKYTIGYINDTTFTGNNLIPFPIEYRGIKTEINEYYKPNENIIDRGLKTVYFTGKTDFNKKPEIYFNEEENRRYSCLLPNDKEILIAIHPGAEWQHRAWPFEKYIKLIDTITQNAPSSHFILLGGKKEKKILKEYIPHLNNQSNISNYISKLSLRETAYLVSKCRLFIGSDSGIMHLASAVNTPILGLFGPSTKERTGPYGNGNLIIRHEVPCSPCEQIKCRREPSCMDLITVEEVAEKVLELVKSKNE